VNIDIAYKNGETIVDINGAIDSYTYPLFAKEINILTRTGTHNLTMNFLKCSKVNVLTIIFLLRIHNLINKRKGKLQIINIGEDEAELLSLMKKNQSKDDQAT
jgi:anti-anti-sigma regulatory factor